MSLLHIENLCVDFETADGPVRVVDKVSLEVAQGEIRGIVGESGSGKSVLALAIMGLLSANASIRADFFAVNDQDVMRMPLAERRKFISRTMAIIFQEPQSSLNPSFPIGYQLDEAIKYHCGGKRRERRRQALELLDAVGIGDAENRLQSYPHQFSGGMNQRLMIAIAIACQPSLMVADEPTTALDVTIQAQILDLLMTLNRERNMSLVLITHDFAILSDTTHKVDVMYCGEIVESGKTAALLEKPYHPYTQALLDSVPQFGLRHKQGSRLFNLHGSTPPMRHLPIGCYLGPRCPHARRNCVEKPRLENMARRKVRCHFPLNQEKQ